jgi:phenylalanyl-tRNA synthetase beta chain
MRKRLHAAGVRPINNIVDITNYVMLEYGQPMHAFDYRYVKGGKIIVRRAAEGEELTTLDGNVRALTNSMLVIADDTRAVGLAGIMGGQNSEIVADTADVVFESANFNGTSIRRTALALGMRTEASAKFEKGLDIQNTVPAVDRACELVEMLSAGEVLPETIDIRGELPAPRRWRSGRRRSTPCWVWRSTMREMRAILRKLGFSVDESDMVTVPSCAAMWSTTRIWPRRWPASTATMRSPTHSCAAPPPRAATIPARCWSAAWARSAAPRATMRSSPIPSSAPLITTTFACRRIPPCVGPCGS